MNSPKDYLTDRVKKKILSIIKNYAGEGNDDFVNKLVALLNSEVERTVKEIDEKMIENFGKGNYMDKQSLKKDCRACYIDGFTDCMSKFRRALSELSVKK